MSAWLGPPVPSAGSGRRSTEGLGYSIDRLRGVRGRRGPAAGAHVGGRDLRERLRVARARSVRPPRGVADVDDVVGVEGDVDVAELAAEPLDEGRQALDVLLGAGHVEQAVGVAEVSLGVDDYGSMVSRVMVGLFLLRFSMVKSVCAWSQAASMSRWRSTIKRFRCSRPNSSAWSTGELSSTKGAPRLLAQVG